MDIKGVQDVGTFRKGVCHKINTYTQRITYSLNIEKSIYNYTVDKGKQLKIIRKWDNVYFVLIYVKFQFCTGAPSLLILIDDYKTNSAMW